MTALSTAELDRLYDYIATYIRKHRCGPTRHDVTQQLRGGHTNAALQTLQALHKIRLMPWRRGIVLTDIPGVGSALQPNTRIALEAIAITCDTAIDWKRIAKAFRGVTITKLTANQIGRYYRQRCSETTPEQAEREANVLLSLRCPELFMERRQKLNFDDFSDVQHQKRGCKSCGTKFQKRYPGQLYCSAKCRHREKRRRREATVRGKLLKSQQNKRYRMKYEERERERRRRWRRDHPREYRAQKERELMRRSLRTASNGRHYRHLPPAVGAIVSGEQQKKAAFQGV